MSHSPSPLVLVAIRCIEILGRIAVLGRAEDDPIVSDRDRYDLGFAVLVGGQEGIDDVVAKCVERALRRRSDRKVLSRTALGWSWQELGRRAEAAGFTVVCQAIVDAVAKVLPVGPGDVLLGLPVRERYLHSIATAAQAVGVHPITMRGMLKVEGLVSKDDDRLPASRVVLKASTVQPFIDVLANCLTLDEVADALNVTRKVHQALRREKYIVPVYVSNERNKGAGQFYPREQVDGFLDTILRNSLELAHVEDGLASIADVAQITAQPIACVVRMAYDGEVEFVGRLSTERGLSSVLLDVAEIRRKFGILPQDDALSLPQAAEILGVEMSTLRNIIKAKALATYWLPNTINRRFQQLVDRHELRKFMDAFGTVRTLAKDLGVGCMWMRNRLVKAGVKPAFDCGGLLTLFRRDEAAEVVNRLKGAVVNSGRSAAEKTGPGEDASALFVLRDDHWELMSKVIFSGVGTFRHSAVDYRRFVEAVLWVARTNSYWCELPEAFGSTNAVWSRLKRWNENSVWSKAFAPLVDDPTFNYEVVANTIRPKGAMGGVKIGRASTRQERLG